MREITAPSAQLPVSPPGAVIKSHPCDNGITKEKLEFARGSVSSAVSSNTSSSSIELPPKNGSSLSRKIKVDVFSTYRELFTCIFIFNIVTLIILVTLSDGWPKSKYVASIVSFDIMVASLFRQEDFVNLVYEVFTACPLSAPLCIRRRLAKVFHYGGMHSGFASSAVVWFMLYIVLITRECIRFRNGANMAEVVTAYLLIFLFLAIIVHAHPKMRVKHHDRFEAIHRYAGWTALVLFWSHLLTVNITAANNIHENPGSYLVKQPNFWFILVSTGCNLLSWGRLRKREVFAEKLSDHATRLHFKYRDMPPFYGVKLSRNPCLDNHAFATIPHSESEGRGFSVLVSNAGDWTNDVIQNPPTHLYIKGAPLHGLLYTSRLFRNIIVIGTGSGIGPTLSLMSANATPLRVLWSARSPMETYGEKVVSHVLNADPNAVIWDTKLSGRPDILALAYQLYCEAQAEAVFIISNPKVTRIVVRGLTTRGIPAYGAIFDS